MGRGRGRHARVVSRATLAAHGAFPVRRTGGGTGGAHAESRASQSASATTARLKSSMCSDSLAECARVSGSSTPVMRRVASGKTSARSAVNGMEPVSYTHLTLPTILRV